MLTGNTITKLQEMHLTVMAKALKDQLSDSSMNALGFEDRVGLLVDQEWSSRKNNHLKRLIKNASFSDSEACIENIEYHTDRNLDKSQIARLSTCSYITEHHNVMLLGATGCGKTYLACALGMAAARNFLAVKYIRLPELLVELAIARNNGTFRKVIQQYKKPVLLIIDEWLLYPLKESESRDILEIAEARYKKASTIYCSQFDVPGWREKIGDPIMADAICDRIVHDSYPIIIDCKESMRKRKGIQETDS
jgi:DNA replication protein DnaC